jgi:predicted nucleotidyltransferase
MGNQLDKVDGLDTTKHHTQPGTHSSHEPDNDELRLVERVHAVVPWLDPNTSALVAAIVAVVAAEHPEVKAAILFGSVARHQERPLEDPHPSDVDLLLLVAPDPVRQRLPYARQLALWESIGNVQYRNRTAPREVEVTPVESTLADWDEMFVTNVARDGRLLWIRDANPAERALDALPAAWRHLAPTLTDRTRR